MPRARRVHQLVILAPRFRLAASYGYRPEPGLLKQYLAAASAVLLLCCASGFRRREWGVPTTGKIHLVEAFGRRLDGVAKRADAVCGRAIGTLIASLAEIVDAVTPPRDKLIAN